MKKAQGPLLRNAIGQALESAGYEAEFSGMLAPVCRYVPLPYGHAQAVGNLLPVVAAQNRHSEVTVVVVDMIGS